MSLDDTLAAIAAATGCQWCEGPLGGSPSADFCTPECQQAWAADRTEPLRDYWEPWHRPWDFPGVGEDAARSDAAEDDHSEHVHVAMPSLTNAMQAFRQISAALQAPPFGLPPMTSDLAADEHALRRARFCARTEHQHRAVALRAEMLRERRPAPVVWIRPVGESWQEMGTFGGTVVVDETHLWRTGGNEAEVGIDLGFGQPTPLARIEGFGIADSIADECLSISDERRFQRVWLNAPAPLMWVGERADAVDDTDEPPESPQDRALRLARERNTGPDRSQYRRRGR